jgi:hypothetical protein
MSDNARRTGPAVEARYQLLGWLMQTVERFPRSQKFLLGDRIQTAALDVLDALIEATYTRDRGDSITTSQAQFSEGKAAGVPRKSGHSRRTRGAFSTCTVMCGSGVRTDGTITTREHRKMDQSGREAIGFIAFIVGGPGVTTIVSTSAQPSAETPLTSTAATSWVSELPERSPGFRKGAISVCVGPAWSSPLPDHTHATSGAGRPQWDPRPAPRWLNSTRAL